MISDKAARCLEEAHRLLKLVLEELEDEVGSVECVAEGQLQAAEMAIARARGLL